MITIIFKTPHIAKILSKILKINNICNAKLTKLLKIPYKVKTKVSFYGFNF